MTASLRIINDSDIDLSVDNPLFNELCKVGTTRKNGIKVDGGIKY
jgi:hypothetical protein